MTGLKQFALTVIKWCEDDDYIDRDAILYLAVEHGLMTLVPFDPEKHIDESGLAEPGGDFVILTGTLKDEGEGDR